RTRCTRSEDRSDEQNEELAVARHEDRSVSGMKPPLCCALWRDEESALSIVKTDLAGVTG
ncbi:MAG: hypothetical protein II349_01135, partial [Akkermansia sp.]|nr:hypothetical protein [Akkermansia sp.]